MTDAQRLLMKQGRCIYCGVKMHGSPGKFCAPECKDCRRQKVPHRLEGRR